MSEKELSPSAATVPEADKSAVDSDTGTAAANASIPAAAVTGTETEPAHESTPAAADASASAVDAVVPTPDTKAADTTVQDDAVSATNGVAGGSKKKEKRKSTASVPEHKNKKLNRKKSMPNLNLNVEPGEYWFVQMKGYPNWPAIICDEQMLPESLLSKRPVSAKRPDGTYRADFEEGGKNVRDRRYPVMFLGTNEFAWHINSDLTPLDIDEIKRKVDADDQSKKMSKALWEAYKVASENNDLDYFKAMLQKFDEETVAWQQAQADKEEADEAKKVKRKSVGGATDVDMEDAASDAAPKKAKKSNKRKAPKDVEGDGEGETDKPTTLKKIKIKAPAAPAEEVAPKVKKSKPKKPKAETSAAASPAPRVEETLTPEQLLEKKQKTILYLRHKLQKGFLSRDAKPKEEEMPQMSEHLAQLQTHPNLEAAIIRGTKINKVLKGIVRLDAIPQEDKFTFKKRSEDLLAQWNKSLASDDATPAAPSEPPAATAATTNGVKHDENPAEEEPKTAEPAKESPPAEPKEAAAKEEGDVSMADAPAATAEVTASA